MLNATALLSVFSSSSADTQGTTEEREGILLSFLTTSSQPRTLLGLVNAADHYDVEELKQACINFVGMY